MVLGTFAYCGSGQDTLADALVEVAGFHKYSVGDVIREIARSRDLPLSRENLQSIREEINLHYSKDYPINKLVSLIRSDNYSNIIITGLRVKEELEVLKSVFADFSLIFVSASLENRYQRLIKRREEKDPHNYEEFVKQMAKEFELFDYVYLEENADIEFNFDMDITDFVKNKVSISENVLNEIMVKNGKRS